MSDYTLKKAVSPDSTIDALAGYKHYIFADKKSGKEIKVSAFSEKQAGEKIARGEIKRSSN